MLVVPAPCNTVPLNNAEPALVVVPIVIVSAATLPENELLTLLS